MTQPSPATNAPPEPSPGPRRRASGRGRRLGSSTAIRAGVWLAAWIGSCATIGVQAGAGDPEPASAEIAVAEGILVGRLVEGGRPATDGRPTILWKSPYFSTPFEFPLDSVGAIDFAPRDGRQATTPDQRVVGLWNGDRIVGRVVSIDGTRVIVDPAVGSGAPVAIARGAIDMIRRHDPSDASDDGFPQSWTLSDPGDWQRRGAGLVNRRSAASASRPLPSRVQRVRLDLDVEFEPPAVVDAAEPPAGQPRQEDARDDDRVVSIAIAQGLAAGSNDGFVPYRTLEARYSLIVGPVGAVLIRDEPVVEGGRADLRRFDRQPEGRTTFSLLVDLDAGRAVSIEPRTRKVLADISLDIRERMGDPTVVVEALTEGVVVHGVRVAPWRDDDLSEEGGAGQVLLADGTVRAGVVARLSEGRITLEEPAGADADGPMPIPWEQVAEVRFPAAARPDETRDADAGSVVVRDLAGSSLGGEVVRVAERCLWLSHPGIEGVVPLPLESLASLHSRRSEPAAAPLPGRSGTLTIDGRTMTGCLVAVEPSAAGAGGIGWHPSGSLVGSGFVDAAPGMSAPIVYRVPPVASPSNDDVGWVGAVFEKDDATRISSVTPALPIWSLIGSEGTARVVAVAPRGDGQFIDTAELVSSDVSALLDGPIGSPVGIRLKVSEGTPRQREEEGVVTRVPRMPWGEPSKVSLATILASQDRLLAADRVGQAGGTEGVVVLVGGDSARCEVMAIDERGVTIHRGGEAAFTIPSAAVQAVELIPSSAAPLSPEKFRSLVTLPRSQRSNPPTHLIRSLRGDYLRGRLIALDAEKVQIAVDAEPRRRPTVIPRREVARVIWLHPELLDDDWKPAPQAQQDGLVVEAIGRGGRSRLAAHAIEGDTLVGVHPQFGATRIDLADIDRLILGPGLEDSPRAIPYAQWTLQPAPPPRNRPPR